MPQLKLAGTALGMLALQQLLAVIFPDGFRPDALMIFALALGLRSGSTSSLVFAFALGLLVDLLSGSPPGTYALLRGTACALTRIAGRTLYLRAPVPWAAYAAAYQGIDFVLLGAITLILLPEGGAGFGALMARAPGAMLATGLLAAPLAVLLDRWGIVSLSSPTVEATGRPLL
ncbi:MAG: rod shape-determining protein MreD [Myxococcota bacterium]